MKYLKILLMMLLASASLSFGADVDQDCNDTQFVIVPLYEEAVILDIIKDNMFLDVEQKQQLTKLIKKMYSSKSLGDMAIRTKWLISSPEVIAVDLRFLHACLHQKSNEMADMSTLFSRLKTSVNESDYKILETFYDNLPIYALNIQDLICVMLMDPKKEQELNKHVWAHATLISDYVQEVQKRKQQEQQNIDDQWEMINPELCNTA